VLATVRYFAINSSNTLAKVEVVCDKRTKN